MPIVFGKVVIFGVGLIGGSVALALKSACAAREIVGIGRQPASLTEALRLGIIDRAGESALEVADADMVLLASPVGQMPAIFAAMAPHLGKQTVVTDGGSTKQDVIQAARVALGDKIVRFVPAHPIAGTENSGAAAAKADLFRGKKTVVTALPDNDGAAVSRAEAFWQCCGAEIYRLTPMMHDQVFAAVSHLPHLLAFALVRDLAERPDAEVLFSFAASGFRDFTRIAASHPRMWRDICLANRVALLEEINAYEKQLSGFKQALQVHDGEALEAGFHVARQARRGLTSLLSAVAQTDG
jgi:prephenate dehydrogenase